ncbi:hypothetical protein [Flavobacterium sp. CAU 1735]|uniref:hypothetical protein n=1 Tax=Flavobacterium sp. CAU 1735 TaxID=3140361 RepID=UPI0032617C5F
MDDLLIDLKIDIFQRAKLFIDDMGLFAPFGSKLKNGEIKAVVIMDEKEDILKILEMLKRNFSEEIPNKGVQAGAIAYDITVSLEDGRKTDALCLLLSVDGVNWSEDHHPYHIVNEECVWGIEP